MNTLGKCHNVMDLRDYARKRLPAPIFHFMEGAAESEWTARRNTEAFDERRLLPRYLRDVANVDTSTRLLGQKLTWPVICSPTGASRLFHPEGELAVARAAAKENTVYSLSTASSYSIEDVAAASDGLKIFQLYVDQDRDFTKELIERSKRAGYAALCLTVDVPVIGKRERDLRTGFVTPPKLTVGGILSFAGHPGWVLGQAFKGPISTVNYRRPKYLNEPDPRPRAKGPQLDPSVTWDDVRSFCDIWGGPFILKGVMSADDARRAADMGVTAIMVSNHGGRQLDGAAAPIDVLPDIVRAVGDKLEIILDGGVRRGGHVLKALALGAKACAVGRPYLYGLSVAGEAGVRKALQILRSEFEMAMKLTGCPNVESIDAGLIAA